MKLKTQIFIWVSIIISLLYINYHLSVKFLNMFLSDLKELNIQFFNIHLGETFTIILNLDVLFTIIMLIPIIHIVYYINNSDALYKTERKVFKLLLIPYILMLIGSIFGYYLTINYLIPMMLGYNLEIAIDNFLNLRSILTFTLLTMFYFGLIFQIPIILKMLIKYLFPKEIFKTLRFPFIAIFTIISMAITPGGDLISILVISVPTLVLYELGLIIS